MDDVEHTIAIGAARTVLFVPANRPERFTKATQSGADLVVLDLEDAVPPSEKDEARQWARAALPDIDVVAVRINAVGTPWAEDDLAALLDARRAVMVPKATTSSVKYVADRLIGNTSIIALIETAAGVVKAQAIAASPRVARLAFGSLDLASELCVSPTDTLALLTARSALVLASASAGLPGPVDGVTANLQDATVLRADIEHARRLGFSGKLCIHPNQIDTARSLLSPNDEEILWAERVLQLATDVATDAGGVAVMDGQMIDKPVVDRARRILGSHH